MSIIPLFDGMFENLKKCNKRRVCFVCGINNIQALKSVTFHLLLVCMLYCNLNFNLRSHFEFWIWARVRLPLLQTKQDWQVKFVRINLARWLLITPIKPFYWNHFKAVPLIDVFCDITFLLRLYLLMNFSCFKCSVCYIFCRMKQFIQFTHNNNVAWLSVLYYEEIQN